MIVKFSYFYIFLIQMLNIILQSSYVCLIPQFPVKHHINSCYVCSVLAINLESLRILFLSDQCAYHFYGRRVRVRHPVLHHRQATFRPSSADHRPARDMVLRPAVRGQERVYHVASTQQKGIALELGGFDNKSLKIKCFHNFDSE